MTDEPEHEIPADAMLEQEYEDRNGCSVDNDETVEPDESMDGDHASGLASAGFGTDEDYEHNLCDEGGCD